VGRRPARRGGDSIFTLALERRINYISLSNKKILFKEMKFAEFKNMVKDLPLFSSPQIVANSGTRAVLKTQISLWKKQELILPLKKGLYVLNENDRRITPSREFIANQLVFPSYISLEYALSFYTIIPERVFQVTSVTSKKTMIFENSFGVFSYRSIRDDLFFGFVSLEDENGMQFLIAEKEKALLDFLYFNLSRITPSDLSFLEKSYRMENLDELDNNLMLDYIERFSSKKLSQIIKNLIKTRINR